MMKIETHWVYLWGYWIAADNNVYQSPVASGRTEVEAIQRMLELKAILAMNEQRNVR